MNDTETGNPSPPVISRTAIYVAAGRAIGAREPDPQARNPDALAETLLGDPAGLGFDLAAVRALALSYEEAMQDVEIVSIVRSMTVRTRFIDEALAMSVDRGVRQLVVLGAGFDTHGWRCRGMLAGMRVFEVDRPAMQAFKRQRVDAALGGPPANLSFVPVDFGHDDLAEALALAGYDRRLPTFFILEGVTMYVPEDSLRETFGFIAAHRAPSAVVFDFVSDTLVANLQRVDMSSVLPGARPIIGRFIDLIRDEPWVFGLPAGEERAYLESVGFEPGEILTVGGEESVRRYLTRADGSVVGARTLEVELARIAGGAAEALRLRRQQQSAGGLQIAVANAPVRH